MDGTPSAPGAADDNYVRYAYTDGLKTKEWVDFDGDGVEDTSPPDQVTIYTYGVAKGTSAGDSKISAGHLLWKVQYPDSSGGSDVVAFAYNAQGQQIWMKDQAGNIIETEYDAAGRTTHRKATTIDGDFDDAVQRISTVYDTSGRVSTATQYDDDTGGSVVNEVLFRYDDWGNIKDLEQDRDSAVRAGGSVNSYLTYSEYARAEPSGGRITVRKAYHRLFHVANSGLPAVPTPNQLAILTYEYLSSGNRLDDASSRVTNVKVASTVVAAYEYLGAARVVGIDLPEIEVMSNQGTGSGTYPDLDRFNRPVTSRWTKDLSTDRDFYDVDLTWDRGGNITSTKDNVWPGRDVLYTIDNLDRVTVAEEGTLDSGPSITSRQRYEDWSLSRTGNWDLRRLDLDGDNNFTESGELNDAGSFNKANEWLTRDTNNDTFIDFTPDYDEVGNLIGDADAAGHQYIYDVFGRLRKVLDSGDDLVAEYTYNALGHRIGWHYDVDGDSDVDGSDPWFHFVYDPEWRMVATFRGSDTNAKEFFVAHMPGLGGMLASSQAWGLGSGLDAVILRDKDANTSWGSSTDGVREERAYYCQNWRGDVVTMLKHTGSTNCRVYETYRYSSYGVPFGIPGGDADGDGDVDNDDYDVMLDLQLNGPYTLRADHDLDGTIDGGDVTITYNALVAGLELGRGNLSHSSVGNRRGYCGYEHDGVIHSMCHVRHRVLLTELGRWSRRDPLGYVDGTNLYGYVSSNPIAMNDPLGLWENGPPDNTDWGWDIRPKEHTYCMAPIDGPYEPCGGGPPPANCCADCTPFSPIGNPTFSITDSELIEGSPIPTWLTSFLGLVTRCECRVAKTFSFFRQCSNNACPQGVNNIPSPNSCTFSVPGPSLDCGSTCDQALGNALNNTGSPPCEPSIFFIPIDWGIPPTPSCSYSGPGIG